MRLNYFFLLVIPFFLFSKNTSTDYLQGNPILRGEESGDYNQSARYMPENSWDLFFGVRFLYWYAQENELEIGKERILQNNSNKIKDEFEPNFTYKPGFNVFLGKKFCFDDWNIFGEYIRLHFTVHKTYNEPTNTFFVPYWLSSVIYPTTGINIMKGAWRLKYDMIDLLLSRPFYLGRHLVLTPAFGGRGGMIDQRFHAEYGNQGTSQAKQNTWLVGPRILLDMKWLLRYGMGVLAKMVGGLYYQEFDVSNQQTYPTNVNSSALQLDKETKHVTPNLQIEAGINWAEYFIDNKWHIELVLSYNFEIYFNQNQMRKLSDSSQTATDRQASNVGDLTFHGLTALMRLDF